MFLPFFFAILATHTGEQMADQHLALMGAFALGKSFAMEDARQGTDRSALAAADVAGISRTDHAARSMFMAGYNEVIGSAGPAPMPMRRAPLMLPAPDQQGQPVLSKGKQHYPPGLVTDHTPQHANTGRPLSEAHKEAIRRGQAARRARLAAAAGKVAEAPPPPAVDPPPRRGRPPMSDAQRLQIAEAQRKRWAKAPVDKATGRKKNVPVS